MLFSELENKKILILGFGREGMSTLGLFQKIFPEKMFFVADKNEHISFEEKDSLHFNPKKVKWILGTSYLNDLAQFDVILKSPGIPYSLLSNDLHQRVTSATRLFFDNLDPSNFVIGVTGSKGKSTVSTLIYKALQEVIKREDIQVPQKVKTNQAAASCRENIQNVYLVGNIGKPSLDFVFEKNAIFVHELSSYQLEDFDGHVDIAVFTSFFLGHLLYHEKLEHYFRAKAHIVHAQNPHDFFIYPQKFETNVGRIETPAKKIACGFKEHFWYDEKYFYRGSEKLFPIQVVRIPGKHNLDNVSLVLAVLDALRVPFQVLENVLSDFQCLPHRLSYVGRFRGIDFYDDGLATVPESTMAAIEIFQEQLSTILLGGEDGGSDYNELVDRLLHYRVKNVVLFPDASKNIRLAFEKRFRILQSSMLLSADNKRNRSQKQMSGSLQKKICLPLFFETRDMREAVSFCYEHTEKGKVCLLSTACASYSIWKNFEEKGDLFQQYVREFENIDYYHF